MNWFKKTQKHGVCKECGAHFEPVTGYEARWGDLCGIHRKPVMERDLKKDRVVAWAARNWERLTEQMEKENAEERAAYADHQRRGMGALSENYRGQAQGALQQVGCLGRNVFGLGDRP